MKPQLFIVDFRHKTPAEIELEKRYNKAAGLQ